MGNRETDFVRRFKLITFKVFKAQQTRRIIILKVEGGASPNTLTSNKNTNKIVFQQNSKSPSVAGGWGGGVANNLKLLF